MHFLTVGDLAEAPGVNPRTVQRRIASGELTPAHRTPSGHARLTSEHIAVVLCFEQKLAVATRRADRASVFAELGDADRDREHQMALALVRTKLKRRRLRQLPAVAAGPASGRGA
jgi:hypothetical protein